MSIFKWPFSKEKEVQQEEVSKDAFFGGQYTPLLSVDFDGEKTPGELGPVIEYDLDNFALRARGWEAYLSSDIAQTITKRFVMWIVGKGLRLQCEPSDVVLNSEGFKGLDIESFCTTTEARFNLHTQLKESDYKGLDNTQRLASTILTNAIVGGDVLCVQRVTNGIVNTQLIDGMNISTPIAGDAISNATKRGNRIDNGIELNSKGEHVAFHVKVVNEGIALKYKRILAKGPASGQTMAFLVTGFKYKIDDNRGIPLFSAVLENIKKLDRYKEAIVGTAEEQAKVVYQIVHGRSSTGDNPLANNMTKAIGRGNELPTDVNGKQLADNVAATTNKSTFNMPVDSELKALGVSGSQANFETFLNANKGIFSATFGIPPEVAFMKYDSNYSASRAAIKDWEHSIGVWRNDLSFQFYNPTYKLWLHLQIITGKIIAEGYLSAVTQDNVMALAAFRNARFIGASVPHIDPVKEVAAQRLKLGKTGENIPLTTAEKATEALDEGDYNVNVIKYAKELVDSKELKILQEPKILAPIKEGK